MKRTAIVLLVLTLIWVGFAVMCIAGLNRAAGARVGDACFDNAGKWYTSGVAR